jgi:hypothetical protein
MRDGMRLSANPQNPPALHNTTQLPPAVIENATDFFVPKRIYVYVMWYSKYKPENKVLLKLNKWDLEKIAMLRPRPRHGAANNTIRQGKRLEAPLLIHIFCGTARHGWPRENGCEQHRKAM